MIVLFEAYSSSRQRETLYSLDKETPQSIVSFIPLSSRKNVNPTTSFLTEAQTFFSSDKKIHMKKKLKRSESLMEFSGDGETARAGLSNYICDI